MRKMLFCALVCVALCGCKKSSTTFVDDVEPNVESFETQFEGDYHYGYETDNLTFEHFYNEEFGYWGGFALTRKFDTDAANGLFENQYAVYNASASEGDGALIYYYDSYNEPCDIVLKDATMLTSVRLNLTTYTYASITDEDINSFARTFADGDYLKVVFTAMSADEALDSVECYVVDYRDGKRFVATNWDIYDLRSLGKGYDAVRVTIETTDVGEYGANTPLYISLDELNFL
mgnify:FL=1